MAYNETDSSISLFSTAHGCFLSFNHRPTFFFFSEKELELAFTGTNSSEVNTKLELLMLNPAEGTVAFRIELTEHRKVKWLCVSADESMVKTVDASEKGASVPECAKFRCESIADNNETIATK